MSQLDTIFALASGAGRAAVAVIRISGPGTGAVIKYLSGSIPPPRKASLRRLLDRQKQILDEAIVLWMPGPSSYTGEDIAELHLHGGRAVLAAVSDALLDCGLRPAEAGEFTRRAFLAGKMDLLQAEAIADLIDAETAAQRRQAQQQAAGALGAKVEDWSGRLRQALAWQEALIDFPDEHLPQSVENALHENLERLEQEMAAALQTGESAARLREGLTFVLIGAPNVGKSSLLNALARRDVAIVSPTAGTTRDTLEVALDLAGIPVTLVDTAGLRETTDPVEQEGVRRAKAKAAAADLVLGVIAPEAPQLAGEADLLIGNKADLWKPPKGAVAVNALTGMGLEALLALMSEAAMRLAGPSADPAFSRRQHHAAILAAAQALSRAKTVILPELRAEELRTAMQAVGRLTGAVDPEAVLGEIFAAFCIGK